MIHFSCSVSPPHRDDSEGKCHYLYPLNYFKFLTLSKETVFPQLISNLNVDEDEKAGIEICLLAENSLQR